MAKTKGIWDSKDCALILIDYQPEMFRALRSTDPKLVELNVGALTKAALAFNIPVVLSTVGVAKGVNHPTIPSLEQLLPNHPVIDRTTMNAWEDKNFLKAVKDTGKKRLIFCALWTEICLAFPVVDALKDDYEVCFVVDAVGGQSKEEHETAVMRLIQAGAVPNTTFAMIVEWFHDWNAPLATQGRQIIGPYLKERSEVLAKDYPTERPHSNGIHPH
ncbi:hydrolase [Bdellovibrio sp. 22V]|uniref:hydrolase n=1 Tax=Bdellovibrio TaxID=958 RepID=UPI0025427435|nr:hydrolase [Bdellovibrio sp. 22V]WII73922.1 hydrolase [Bdellovibrio sp. 22V]